MTIKITKAELKRLCPLFILMFVSNDTYLFGTNSNEFMVALPRYLMLGYCIVNFIFAITRKDYVQHRHIIELYLIMLFVFVIVSYFHHEHFNRALIKVLCMTTAMFVCVQYKMEDYAETFLKCMTLFSVSAILLTLLAYVSPFIVTSLPSIINTVGVRFYSIGLAGLDERSLGTLTVRAGGIFWEPGVFQMYINLAVLFELMLHKGKNKKRLIIYTIALIITFSTTGYLAFMWLIVTYVFFGRDDSRSVSKNVCVFIALILAAFLVYFIMVYTVVGQVVFGKLFDLKNGSTFVRQASVLINLEIVRDHPFMGIGMELMEDEFERRSYLSTAIYGWTRQNTNTLLYQFAAHGIFFGLPFTLGTYKFGEKLSNKFFMKLSIFVMLLMLYIGENLMTSIFPYILVFYGIDQIVVSIRQTHFDVILRSKMVNEKSSFN